MRRLIVNADDLGQSRGINRGIARAHEGGIVTSASLMVRFAAAADAAGWAARQPALSLGLHLDLGEWAFHDGAWRARYVVADLADATAVEREVRHQIDAFTALAGHPPTHLDSHQHVHRDEPVRSIALAAAVTLGVPLRGCDPRVGHCGGFYGQTAEGATLDGVISLAGLAAVLSGLGDGTHELGCHPGYAGDLETTYRDERAREVEVLTDPGARRAVAAAGLTLCSFAALAAREATVR
jgi:predicted glycoside hydrolase/deacetylase ChbG (UPF0249 family)